MGVLNREVVDTINEVYSDIYNEAADSPTQHVVESKGLVHEISGVTAPVVNLAWMKNYVRMRLWRGERQVNDGELFDHLMRNAKYESTISTRVEDVEDRVYALKGKSDVQELRDAYDIRKAEEFGKLLADAFTSTDTLDGVALISDSHPQGELEFDDTRPEGEQWKFNADSTWSNLTTDLFDETALWDARENMLLRRDHLGQPVTPNADLLIVGPKLERTARQILTRDAKAENNAAVDNETKGLVQYTVEPRITDAKWFLVDSNPRRKPFVFWNRVAPQFQMLNGTATAEGDIDYYTFMNDEILHGIRARMGFAFGAPEFIYGSDASGA